MKLLKNIPLFFFLLICYNILAFFPVESGAGNVFDSVLFEFRMMSGGMVKINVNTLFILIGLHCLYFEILKSARASVMTIINHTLSLIVFIVFLVEFIVVTHAGTAAFLIMTVMSLLVVISGFTVSISTARRDIVVDR